MIIERPQHETIISVPSCKYLAAVESLYGSEDIDAFHARYVRFGDVGFNDAIHLYPDEFDTFRELLAEVEAYLRPGKP